MCFNTHVGLPQSEENKCMWTHSKDGAMWVKNKITIYSKLFLIFVCSISVINFVYLFSCKINVLLVLVFYWKDLESCIIQHTCEYFVYLM